MALNLSSSARILIVDDDPISVDVARRRLSRAGYDVVVYDGALGSTTHILRTRPDVVLMDVRMPGFEGDQLVEMIKQNAPERAPKMLLYSSLPPSDLAMATRRCGADGFVEKTAGARELVQAVHIALSTI